MKIYGPKLEPRSKLGHENRWVLEPENSWKFCRVRTLQGTRMTQMTKDFAMCHDENYVDETAFR